MGLVGQGGERRQSGPPDTPEDTAPLLNLGAQVSRQSTGTGFGSSGQDVSTGPGGGQGVGARPAPLLRSARTSSEHLLGSAAAAFGSTEQLEHLDTSEGVPPALLPSGAHVSGPADGGGGSSAPARPSSRLSSYTSEPPKVLQLMRQWAQEEEKALSTAQEGLPAAADAKDSWALPGCSPPLPPSAAILPQPGSGGPGSGSPPGSPNSPRAGVPEQGARSLLSGRTFSTLHTSALRVDSRLNAQLTSAQQQQQQARGGVRRRLGVQLLADPEAEQRGVSTHRTAGDLFLSGRKTGDDFRIPPLPPDMVQSVLDLDNATRRPRSPTKPGGRRGSKPAPAHRTDTGEEEDEAGELDLEFGEEEASKPLWRRPGFWKVLASLAFTLSFMLAGILVAVFQSNERLESWFQWWRLLIFISTLVPIWWIGTFVGRASIWVTEKSFFTLQDVLYFVYTLRKPLANVMRSGLLMASWAVCMYESAFDDRETNSQIAQFYDAYIIILKLCGCLLLFFVAELLKVLFAKMIASKFNRESHVRKMHAALKKERYLDVLLQPKARAWEEPEGMDRDGQEGGDDKSEGGGFRGDGAGPAQMAAPPNLVRRSAPMPSLRHSSRRSLRSLLSLGILRDAPETLPGLAPIQEEEHFAEDSDKEDKPVAVTIADSPTREPSTPLSTLTLRGSGTSSLASSPPRTLSATALLRPQRPQQAQDMSQQVQDLKVQLQGLNQPQQQQQVGRGWVQRSSVERSSPSAFSTASERSAGKPATQQVELDASGALPPAGGIFRQGSAALGGLLRQGSAAVGGLFRPAGQVEGNPAKQGSGSLRKQGSGSLPKQGSGSLPKLSSGPSMTSEGLRRNLSAPQKDMTKLKRVMAMPHGHRREELDSMSTSTLMRKGPVAIASKMARVEKHIRKRKLQVTFYDELGQMERKEKVTNQNEAKRLAFYLFYNVKTDFDRPYLTIDDLEAFLNSEKQAQEAFQMLDCDGNGRVNLAECASAVMKIFEEREYLAASLKDTKLIVSKLGFMIGIGLHIMMFFVYLLILGLDAWKVFIAIVPVLGAVSFALGSSVKQAVDNSVFLFVTHPFDVGDLISFQDTWFKVLEITLPCTILLRTSDSAKIWYPNTQLINVPIHNLTVSPPLAEITAFIVDAATPLSVVEDVKSAVAKYCQSRPQDFNGQVSAWFAMATDATRPNRLSLRVKVGYNYNMLNSRCFPARGALFHFILSTLASLKVEVTNVVQPVLLLGAEVLAAARSSGSLGPVPSYI